MQRFSSPVLSELQQRGFIKNISRPEELDAIIMDGGKVAVYAGFDATARSLHAGHLISILGLKIFADHGHEAVAVVGNATALVGDPTGRNDSRPALDMQNVEDNADEIAESLLSILGNVNVSILYNRAWLGSLSLPDFLLETAASIGAGRILSLETFSSRLANGRPLSMMELLYPLLQAADFQHFAFMSMCRGARAAIQLGGSDQWGNICVGLDLIEKRGSDIPAFGITTPLLTKADGTKMGKTAGGAAWLSPAMLDDRGFFQFWRDVEDAQVPVLARLFAAKADDDINIVKENIAIAATDLVRGNGRKMAAEARAVFSGGGNDGLPRIAVLRRELEDLALILVKCGFSPSKRRARTLVSQGGVRLDGEKISPRTSSIKADLFRDREIRLSAGRKRHVVLRLAEE